MTTHSKPRLGAWYYGWNIVGVTLVIQAAAFGVIVYGFGLWVEPWSQEFGASRGEIMFGVTLMNIASALASPLIGHALARYPIRWLVVLGAVLMAAGLVAVSFATGFLFVLAMYMLVFSIVVVLVGPLSASTLMANWFDRSRGLAIGISAIGTSIGGLLLPVLMAWLLLEYGWREAHLYLAALTLVAIIPPALWFIHNSPEDKGVDPEPPARVNHEEHTIATPQTPQQWTTEEILRERLFWVLCVSLGLMMMAFMGLMPNLVPYALDAGIDVTRASVMITVLAAGGIVGKLCMGPAADRVDMRYLIWIAILLLGLPTVLLTMNPGYAGLLVISAMVGLSSGGFTRLIGATIAIHFGQAAFSRVMGLTSPFTMGIGLFGPPMNGYIYDATGTYDLALNILTGMLVIAAVVTFFLKLTPAARR